MLSSTSPSQITVKAQQIFMAVRQALEDAQDFYLAMSAESLAQLETIGLTAADAQAILTAAADANQLAGLYNGGPLTGTYAIPYNFSTSQRAVIGP